jgi:putative nucleotidyltransferase with HDIG domain
MSLAFGVLLTVVQAGDRYVDSWSPRFGMPTPVTLRVPYGPRLVRDRSTGRAQFHYRDQRTIVGRGTTLHRDDEAHQTAYLFALDQRPPQWPRLFGILVIGFTLAMALTGYMRNFGQNRLRLLRTQAGLLLGMIALAVGAKALLLFTALSPYWIPISVVPLSLATVFDRRTALVAGPVLAFLVATLAQFDLIVLCILLARSVTATLAYWDRRRPRQVVTSGFVAGLSAVAFYVAVVVTFEGNFDLLADVFRGLDSQTLAVCGGGAAGGLLAAVLRPSAERLLGNVPRERLLELQDLSQPLLMLLARKAPGTYEHSRAMANLAEQAASSIGADALLTRVGAYYHDLGKSAQPKYFVENQEPGENSPHDGWDPEESAKAIMAHVVVGTRILREGGIPESVVEFAYTHHGTQVVEFFWNRCLDQGNPKELTEDDFRYPGMRPQTRETAILMLVDSIEAASRTIDPPAREQFEHLVQRIAFTKLRSGQLDECGLTLSELRIVSNRVTDALVNMNHHRIRYPWQVAQAEEFGVPHRAMLAADTRLDADDTGATAPARVNPPGATGSSGSAANEVQREPGDATPSPQPSHSRSSVRGAQTGEAEAIPGSDDDRSNGTPAGDSPPAGTVRK